MRQAYRPDIDGLRMIAIVPVVLYHAGVPWLPGGFIGVDVFFVISGFLIAGVLLGDLTSGRFSLIGFYERRARRILPALFMVLFASFVAGYFILSPENLLDMSQAATATVLFSSNFWFSWTTSNYFADYAEFEPLLHTWTLGVEEQFYILFPLLLWGLFRGPGKVALPVVMGLTVVSFIVSIIDTESNPAASFYLLPSRGWELGLGALLALGFGPRLSVRWLREVVAMTGLAAILAAAFLYDASTPFPGLAALLPCLGAAALISAGAEGPNLASRALSLKPFVFVGLISYSLYLWHWPILAFLRIYIGEVGLPPAIAAGAVAAAFIAAVISWAYVERPFRRRPPQGLKRAKIFVLSGIAASVVLALALGTGIGDGLPNRFPPNIRLAFAGTTDRNLDTVLQCQGFRPESADCRFGAEKAPKARFDFLVWGDSHAAASMPGIAAAANQRHKSGLYAGRYHCPPLLKVERVDLGPRHHCAAVNAAVFRELEKRDDIPLVILAARWALNAEGYGTWNERGSPPLLGWENSPEGGPHDPDRNFKIFRAAISETVEAIRSTGRQVIILGDVPEIGWDVPRRLGGHLAWGQPMPPAPTIENVSRRQQRVASVFAELADPPSVRFLPLTRLLCNPVCRTQHEGRPLYYDRTHLSRSGSISIFGPLFLEKVWR